MLDILLISDQPRLHAIFTTACSFPDGSFRIATSLAQGLQHIGDKTPDLLFLQNRLSGLAGRLLVRHVRNSSESKKTKIILLVDGTGENEESTADIELHTNVSDAELSDAVTEMIGDILPEDATATSAVSFTSTPAIPTTPAVDAFDAVSISSAPGRTLPATTRGERLKNLPQSEMAAKLAGIDPKQQTTILSSSPPPIQWEKRRLMIAITTLLAVAFTGIVLYIAANRPFIPQPTLKPASPAVVAPNKTVPPPAEPVKAAEVKPPEPLPRFIQIDTPDPKYPQANPGWERYLSPKREYKIYRENGEIRAIQIIDSTGAGISPGFFTSVLRDMARVSDYKLESKEKKDGFVIKKGRISPQMRVIIYKDRSDRILNAFVIHVQKQEAPAPVAKEKP